MNEPLDLSRDEARKIEHAVLGLRPFSGQSWPDAVENYLILRWVLGLGPATVREIVDALERAQFRRALDRTTESCRATVHRVLRNRKFLVTDFGERRRIRYHPRQYTWHPSKTIN